MSAVDLLERFDTDFAETAHAISRGEYLFWLGSGISRDSVPGLQDLLLRVLSRLQERADASRPDCAYVEAIREILDLAELSESETEGVRPEIDLSLWPNAELVAARLVKRYAEVLDVGVRGQSSDFILLSVLDAAEVYGSPDIAPCAEHIAIAMLIIEGVVPSIPTANWDGLVEKALHLNGHDTDALLRVVVTPEDLTKPRCNGPDLIKFHGCAVRASEDPERYAPFLVGRSSQIDGWAEAPENRLMKGLLSQLFATSPALILGLSAQDPNIRAFLHRAGQDLRADWRLPPPSVVFAEEQLHQNHRGVLKATYGADEYATNRAEIDRSALLGSYARPVLVALLLFVLTEKLCLLLRAGVFAEEPDGEDASMACGFLRLLRNVLAPEVGEESEFLESLRRTSAILLTFFRTGRVPTENHERYEALSTGPIHTKVADPDYPTREFSLLSCVLALLAQGVVERDWKLSGGLASKPEQGSICLSTGSRTAHLFLVKDSTAFAGLEASGVLARNPSTLVIQCSKVPRRSRRSPRSRYGRSTRASYRSIDFDALCREGQTQHARLSRLALEGGL